MATIPRTTGTRGRRLSGRGRKAALTTHICTSVGWLGVDVVLAVFVLTAALSTDPLVIGASYYGIAIFAVWAKLPLGVLSLVSGVLLGWGTKYGLVRYWWVAVKLVLNLVLVLLTATLLRSSVDASRTYGEQVLTGQVVLNPPEELIYPVIVSPSALLFAIVLSVYKPWGRVRRTPSAAAA